MTTQIFLGEPLASIKNWIINHTPTPPTPPATKTTSRIQVQVDATMITGKNISMTRTN